MEYLDKFDNFHLDDEHKINEELDRDLSRQISINFISYAKNSLGINIISKLGGAYALRNTFDALKNILRVRLVNAEPGFDVDEFTDRFIHTMRKRILYPTIVQRLGGTYIMDSYFEKWEIKLKEMLNDI